MKAIRMAPRASSYLTRRRFLATAATASACLLGAGRGLFARPNLSLLAGEGVVDVTPPLGITMGGFHFPPSNPRRIEGVRQRAFARALYLRAGGTDAVMISLPTLNASREFVRRVQERLGEALEAPPEHVRVCASHSHSMPTIAFNRQWGDQHFDYFDELLDKLALAAARAQADLGPAELYLGSAVAEQANANRTASIWKNEDQFGPDSTEEDRWLDRRVRVLHFERPYSGRNILWYHFSAHPTCYTDRLCGPDWPGVLEERYHELDRIHPAFLQGHIGDVSPGGGGLGDAGVTAFHLCRAIPKALRTARRVTINDIRVAARDIHLPVDIGLLRRQIAAFRASPHPEGSFEQDWHANFATRYDQSVATMPTAIAGLGLGDLAMLFHPSELYSFYGLAIERASTARDTIVVGYAEDYIGYLPDPRAFRDNEYAAIVVPKILNRPPFTPGAAARLVGEASALLAAL